MKSNANGQNAEVYSATFFFLSVKNFWKLHMIKGKWVHLGSGFRTISQNSLRFAQTLPLKFISWNDDRNVIVNATNNKREKKDAQADYEYQN